MDSAKGLEQSPGNTLYLHVRNSLQRACPDLAVVDDPKWQEIISTTNQVSLPVGTRLLSPDNVCRQFMLLVSGCVRVYQQTPNDREVTLYRIHEGDLCVLSVNGLMHKKKFGAFAECESEITALTFTREQFMRAMEIYEPFREFVLTGLTDRFRDVISLVEETVFESLDTRMVCMLARLSRESGDNTLKITHQELARELGTSREVISRLLKGFEKQGCIKLGRGVIHVMI